MKTYSYQRFIARNVDYVLMGILLSIIFSEISFSPKIESILNNEYAFVMLCCFVLIPFEILQVFYFNTTIGKKLFGISVTKKNGDSLTVNDAAKRSLLVWFEGVGCAIPAIGFIATLFSFNYIEKNGETPWDKQLSLKIEKTDTIFS